MGCLGGFHLVRLYPDHDDRQFQLLRPRPAALAIDAGWIALTKSELQNDMSYIFYDVPPECTQREFMVVSH